MGTAPGNPGGRSAQRCMAMETLLLGEDSRTRQAADEDKGKGRWAWESTRYTERWLICAEAHAASRTCRTALGIHVIRAAEHSRAALVWKRAINLTMRYWHDDFSQYFWLVVPIAWLGKQLWHAVRIGISHIQGARFAG